MKQNFLTLILFLTSTALRPQAQKRPVDYVNPFLGTAPLTSPADIGFDPLGGFGPDWFFQGRRCPTPWCS